MIDLRRGRWQDVLVDVESCDHVITDPPYSARMHDGHNAGEEQMRSATGQATRTAVSYDAMTPEMMSEFISWCAHVSKGWIVVMTSHDLVPVIEKATPSDRYCFAPVPIFQKRPRLLGDGPASWTIYMVASRPRSRAFLDKGWGCLPGAYEALTVRGSGIAGAKPLGLMEAIVEDYSRPGELVVDPFCGTGTTALACAGKNRSCITSEVDLLTYTMAKKRLERGYTPDLFTAAISQPET